MVSFGERYNRLMENDRKNDWIELNGSDVGQLDYRHLHHYTMGDRTLARELLELFSKQSNLYLNELLNIGQASEEKRKLAHALKGSSRCIGALDVSKIAAFIEGNPEQDHSDSLEALKENMNILLREIKDFCDNENRNATGV